MTEQKTDLEQFRGALAGLIEQFDADTVRTGIREADLGIDCPVFIATADCGGRIMLNGHDAPRFHITATPFSTPMSFACPGCEPFGTDELVRDAALWAGSGTGTGLVIFNDSQGFSGSLGWNNPELNLPGRSSLGGRPGVANATGRLRPDSTRA